MSKKITCLIVDDEPLARKGIRALLKDEKDITVVAECADGIDAVEQITSRHPDLVFLDIQMPGLDGFGVIEAIGIDKMPVIVFVTAYDLHALKAFQVHAIDYLLKPLQTDRFKAALERARTMVFRTRPDDLREKIAALVETLRPSEAQYTTRFIIRSTGRVTVIPITDVEWMEAEGDYVQLHTTSGKKQLLREKISSLEAQLDPSTFIRIHRSTIVRIDKIRELRPLFNGDHVLFLQDGSQLSLSRTYREKVFRSLQQSQ